MVWGRGPGTERRGPWRWARGTFPLHRRRFAPRGGTESARRCRWGPWTCPRGSSRQLSPRRCRCRCRCSCHCPRQQYPPQGTAARPSHRCGPPPRCPPRARTPAPTDRPGAPRQGPRPGPGAQRWTRPGGAATRGGAYPRAPRSWRGGRTCTLPPWCLRVSRGRLCAPTLCQPGALHAGAPRCREDPQPRRASRASSWSTSGPRPRGS